MRGHDNMCTVFWSRSYQYKLFLKCHPCILIPSLKKGQHYFSLKYLSPLKYIQEDMMKLFIQFLSIHLCFFLFFRMSLKKLFYLSNLYALPVPALCQLRYVTCNKYEKLHCGTYSIPTTTFCLRSWLQLPRAVLR